MFTNFISCQWRARRAAALTVVLNESVGMASLSFQPECVRHVESRMPPAVTQWQPCGDVCVCCQSVFKCWNAVFLCNVCVSGFSLGPAGRQDGHFDVKACKKISFQYLHAHCMCAVSCSVCNPSCHSDGNPVCATGGRCFLTESKEAIRGGDTGVWTACTPRWRDKHAAITITSYKSCRIKSVFVKPVICWQMWRNRKWQKIDFLFEC